MPAQIVLAWQVDVTNSPYGPVQAAAALAAVPLYDTPSFDPVLGQFFGLAVASDITGQAGSTATRTLTLNMTPFGLAPSPFPCHPRTSTPPVLPYPLRRTVSLVGSFFVSNSSMSVPTTTSQLPSLRAGDSVQFLSQQGVSYTVASVSSSVVGLTAPYTGTTSNSEAFKELAAPVTRAALYSTSPLDTNGVATSPAIPAGSGARTVILSYKDSTGAGPFNVSVLLTGKRPVAVTLDPGSTDIASIEAMYVLAAGTFGSGVGQITLVELSEALPPILSNRTPADFVTLTDEAQMLISQSLAYLPPSYLALSAQSLSTLQLLGDFIVTTGSKDVPTTSDQSGSLSGGDKLQFASQRDTVYTVAAVTPKIVTLTTAYSGIDDNFTGGNDNSKVGTKGNLGPSVIAKRTGASSIAGTTPSNAQLSTLLAQFVDPEVATPPPGPPLPPGTVPAPTFLSGLFTRTLQLALKGVPVVPQPITFA